MASAERPGRPPMSGLTASTNTKKDRIWCESDPCSPGCCVFLPLKRSSKKKDEEKRSYKQKQKKKRRRIKVQDSSSSNDKVFTSPRDKLLVDFI